MTRPLTIAITCGVLAVACSEPSTTTKTTPNTSSAMTRPVTLRAKLPAAIQPLLPRHGLYAAGGGLVSSAWRVVLDLDAMTLFGGTAGDANAPSFGPMDPQTTRPLSPRNAEHLMQLGFAAWAEPPSTPSDPTVDYDEIFIVLQGDDTFFLQGYGPIRQPVAADTIVQLRAAAGL